MLANQITDKLRGITAVAKQAKAHPAIAGTPPPTNPDDSVGKPATDLTTLRYLRSQYENLWNAVESADAAPTADMRAAFAKLNATLGRTMARLR